jgi:DNA primase
VQGRRHLVVVEGCFSVFRLHAVGVPAVALLGRTMSSEQLSLLGTSGVKYLTVLLDGDEAGRSAVPAMMELLCRSPLRVKFALLPDGTQPDTVEEPILRELLGLR